MKVSEDTSVSMPIKNMVGIIVAVAMGIFAYTEVTARLTSLETSRELFQADLLKKSEQLPTDQEQYMLLEHLAGEVENIQEELEDFHHCILENRKPRVSLHDGARALEVAKKIMESI